jgi:thiosulfate reductase cytochrome b subunit
LSGKEASGRVFDSTGNTAAVLAMSNTLSAAWPALSELFGGHQSARSVHFIIALALVIFILVHLFQVVVSGFVNLNRSMITERFVVERENTP